MFRMGNLRFSAFSAAVSTLFFSKSSRFFLFYRKLLRNSAKMICFSGLEFFDKFRYHGEGNTPVACKPARIAQATSKGGPLYAAFI